MVWLRLCNISVFLMFLVLTNCDEGRDLNKFFGFFNKPTTPKSVDACDCECGKANDGSRIVGGENTLPNQFPWVVYLSYFKRFYCGGTLITDRHVLTAAHCVRGFFWFMIKVTMGQHDKCSPLKPPVEYYVSKTRVGDFRYTHFKNDNAILFLSSTVYFTSEIRPICLPMDEREQYVGKRAMVVGWGTTKEAGNLSCQLKGVEVPVLSTIQCRNKNYSESMISEIMLCAGYDEGGKDSCQGDSGGPLIYQRPSNRYEIIGITSWGEGCARPYHPGVYTRVTSQMQWIKDNTKEGCYCKDPDKIHNYDTPIISLPQTNNSSSAIMDYIFNFHSP